MGNETYRGKKLDGKTIVTIGGFTEIQVSEEDLDWGRYGDATRRLAEALVIMEFVGDAWGTECPPEHKPTVELLYQVLAKTTGATWELDSHYLRSLAEMAKWDDSKVHVHHFREFRPSSCVRLTLAAYPIQVKVPGEDRDVDLVVVGSALYNPTDKRLEGVEGSRRGGRAAATAALKRVYESAAAGLLAAHPYHNGFVTTSAQFKRSVSRLRFAERAMKLDSWGSWPLSNSELKYYQNLYRRAASGKLTNGEG